MFKSKLPHMLCAKCDAEVARDAYYCKKCGEVIDDTLAHRASELASATHAVELKPSVTVVSIDTIHRGVGTASCGPDTLEKYLIKPGKYTLAYTLTYK